MRKYFSTTLFFITLALLFSSCLGYKNLVYFRDISDSANVYTQGVNVPVAPYTPLFIQPDDILNVTISTLNPSEDMASKISTVGGNSLLASTNQSETAGPNASTPGYLVDQEGNIYVPVLGTIHVAGLTTSAIRDTIANRASFYYKDAVVNVQLANFRITLMGEVGSRGTKIINGERVSILDAIGMSGGLTNDGRRENVMLIRQVGENQKKYVRFSLNDTKMLTSPYFYLKQGDIIYVEPTKSTIFNSDQRIFRYISLGSLGLGLISFILSLK